MFFEALASSLLFKCYVTLDLTMILHTCGVEEVKTKGILSEGGQAQSIQTIFLPKAET